MAEPKIIENKSTMPPKVGTLHGVLFALSISFLAEAILGLSFIFTDFVSSFGRCAIVFLTLFVIFRFAGLSLGSFKLNSSKNLLALNVVLLGSIMMIWFGRVVALSIASYSDQSKYFSSISAEALSFAIPWPTAVLILQAILGLHFSFIAAMCITLIAGVYFPEDTLLVPYVLTTCLVAALSLLRFRSRSAYVRAGVNVAIVSIPLSLALFLVNQEFYLANGLVRIVGGFVGGIVCAFLAAGLTPLFEHFGKYVTDMRLIELATLDHPLLKELSIQAPGTWNHSMVMGMMAESAADSIGANPVIARVGAYFHDIGKTKKPFYFVENQAGEENRHDKLSPSMSALIIKAHVKDGLELGKKHNLPVIIQDMIPQHHGTSLVEYFYDKAVKEAKEQDLDPAEVDRTQFTYPGPRPQTKEAGILMLADGIEAAARTLSDPSADRIQGMVQKLINKVFASGELNECELTLQDLHRIAKSFTRILTGIYHQRIAYAEPAEKIRDHHEGVADHPKSPNVTAQRKPEDAGANGAESEHKEDLKRLGIS